MVARLHVSSLSTAVLTGTRACRLQEASDFEKQDALRKFNRAKEAYEVLGDGKPIRHPQLALPCCYCTHPTCQLRPRTFPACQRAPQIPRHVCCAESKRALYESSGRSAVYAAERTGRSQSGPFRSAYAAPRTRTGWSNFWYQQQQYNTHGEHDKLRQTYLMLPQTAQSASERSCHCSLCASRMTSHPRI